MAQQLPEPRSASADPGAAQVRASETRAARPAPGSPVLLLGLAAALAALAYRRLLTWTPRGDLVPNPVGWFFEASYTAPQLVFVIVALLVYRRRRRLTAALGDAGAPLPGAGLLVLGLVLFAWSHHAGAPDVELVSAVPVCLGAALWMYGARFAARLALPVVFLLFAVPLPGVATNQLFYPLQLLAAQHTAALLGAVGIPVVQQGDMLYLAGTTFEVIETCSGLRSMEVLTMLALAWVCFFPVGALHTIGLVLAAPLIAYGVNLGRVVSLVLHPQSEMSAMHSLQGVVLFLAGFGLLYAVDSAWRRVLARPRAEAAPAPPASPTSHRGRRLRAALLVGFFAALLAASFLVPRWEPPRRQRVPVRLPEQVGDWQVVERPMPDWLFLGTTRFTQHWSRRYARDDASVLVFVAYDDRLQRLRSLLSPKQALPGRGWQVEERKPVTLAGGLEAEAVLARSGGQRTLSLHWYEGTGGIAEEIARASLALDQSLARRERGALVARFTTDVPPVAGGSRVAEQRLREIVRPLSPTLTLLPTPR